MAPKQNISKQVEALENQAYILYLQLNAVTKQLLENNTLDKDKLTKDMDDLNDQLYKVAQDAMEENAAAAAEAEAEAETAVAEIV